MWRCQLERGKGGKTTKRKRWLARENVDKIGVKIDGKIGEKKDEINFKALGNNWSEENDGGKLGEKEWWQNWGDERWQNRKNTPGGKIG